MNENSLWDKVLLDRNLPELARMVTSMERRMREIAGDRIPVLGIQGGDIKRSKEWRPPEPGMASWILLISSPHLLSEIWCLGTAGC